MEITVSVGKAWEERFVEIQQRLDCEDREELLLRALGLVDVVSYCLIEPGAELRVYSPETGESKIDLSALYS